MAGGRIPANRSLLFAFVGDIGEGTVYKAYILSIYRANVCMSAVKHGVIGKCTAIIAF